MRIRKINIRSIKVAEKLQYVNLANETRKAVYDEINANEEVYNLYEIPKRSIYTCYNARYNVPRFSSLKRSII